MLQTLLHTLFHTLLQTVRGVIWGALLVSTVLWAQTPAASPQAPASAAPARHKAQTHKKRAAKVSKPVVLPALPGGALRQLPMDQIPSTPATVTYQGGMLSISAKNSPLGDILREIRKLTGATIEIPPQAPGSDERVITHLGPGTPRDVLVALLNGSNYNYVMLGSNSDASMVSSVILTSKTPGVGDTQTAANVVPNNPPPGVVMPPHPMPPQPFNPQAARQGNAGNGEMADEPVSDETQQENSADENTNPDEQVQQEQQGAVDANGQAQDPNQPNAGPKTPEQILEMLRRQQQGPQPQPPPQQQ